jgi:HlyD family secretion protein
MKNRKVWAITLPIAAVVAVAIALVASRGLFGASDLRGTVAAQTRGTVAAYDFATVARGNLESLVSASGSLEPVSTVNVLARMSGRAEKVNVDFNDRVQKGEILVALDTSMLALQRQQAAAAVAKATASRDLLSVDLRNKQALADKGLLSDYDLSTAKTNLASAQADFAEATSSLAVIDTELTDYALVRSPISGVVLSRNVDVGESVIEGGNSGSTSLFTLAGDLSKMEIEAAVDELDIASIRPGQEVRFEVQALPGRSYSGTVRQIRLVPTTTDNVVNYTVIVDAGNPDGSLLPGMTATLEFVKQKLTDVFTVPNAALRFTPTSLSASEKARRLFEAGLAGLSAAERSAAMAKYDDSQRTTAKGQSPTAAASGGLAGMLMPGPGGPGGGLGGPRPSEVGSGTVATGGASPKPLWYLDETGQLRAILVIAGASDGSKTEVSLPSGPSSADESRLDGLSIIVREKL